MSKKFFTLLVLFFVNISALIYISVLYGDTQNIVSPTSFAIDESAHDTSTKLSFMPSMLTATSTESAALDIILQTRSNPEIIQLEISYDPNILYNVDISPGNYFPDPKVSLKKIDTKNGRISYVLEGLHDPTGNLSNIVAKINFDILNGWTEQITNLYFLPKTSVKNDTGKNYLKNMSGAEIIFKPSFHTQISSVSALPITN